MSSEALERRQEIRERLPRVLASDAKWLLAEVARLEQERHEALNERDRRFAEEHNHWRAALAVAREREQRTREKIERIAENAESWHGYLPADDAPGAGHVRALAVIAGWARAALVDEPAAATLAEPESDRESRSSSNDVLGGDVPTPALASGSASAAADEPGETPALSDLTRLVKYGCDGDRTSDGPAASSERLGTRENRSRVTARPSPQRRVNPARPWKLYVPRIGLGADIVASYATEEAALRGRERHVAAVRKARLPMPDYRIAGLRGGVSPSGADEPGETP